MHVNPGLTSRFPEVIDFHGLKPPECVAAILQGSEGNRGFAHPDFRFE
jgi:hypothetical protein